MGRVDSRGGKQVKGNAETHVEDTHGGMTTSEGRRREKAAGRGSIFLSRLDAKLVVEKEGGDWTLTQALKLELILEFPD